MDDFFSKANSKIKLLHDTIWERRPNGAEIADWLNNFEEPKAGAENEKVHALFLLCNFIYFGNREIRELLNAVYRDLYKYPIVQAIRLDNHDTTDLALIHSEFNLALSKTRFLGVGNPSESGSHLLYFFRQENSIPKDLFISSHQILHQNNTSFRVELADDSIDHYVFLDDFCGSGSQVEKYLGNLISTLKMLNPTCKVSYFPLFATEDGVKYVREKTLIDQVEAIFKLDNSYKCFHESSRFFKSSDPLIKKDFAKKMCTKYGKKITAALGTKESDALGFSDCQLLIGFHHNTPDNTLPIIWFDEQQNLTWAPIFRRYPKNYDWV